MIHSATQKPKLRRRSAQRGAMLAFFAVTAAALIGLMGVAIYTGLQAYFQNEVTKTAHTAAMAGASMYYSGQGSHIAPIPNTGYATSVANQVFTNIRSNSPAMQSFSAALSQAPAAGNNMVTVGVRGTFPTPLLAIVGTTEVEVNGTARAKAVRYVPTNRTGPIQLAANPIGGLPANGAPAAWDTRGGVPQGWAIEIPLSFPTIEGTGTEMVIYQHKDDNKAAQQGYTVQACNATNCYNLSRDAVLMTDSRRHPKDNRIIYGGCRVDLQKAKVNKATVIRISDDGIYDYYYNDKHYLLTEGTPDNTDVVNVIDRIELYGYAAACPMQGACPTPVGFEEI